MSFILVEEFKESIKQANLDNNLEILIGKTSKRR